MPKKKDDGESKEMSRVLGRPGNNLKMGIVGLPNVGKSTFFNMLSKLNVAAENFPFCTIDPNVSRVPIPDRKFDRLVTMYKPKSRVPAVLSVTDIAGLVRGASEGAGLGNDFLSHIAAVDGIYHMVRGFSDEEVVHVEGDLDPVRDLQIIHDELLAKDVQVVSTALANCKKVVERGAGGKDKKEELDFLTRCLAFLEEGKDIRGGVWGGRDVDFLNRLQLLTAKPMIYLVNLSARDYVRKRNKWLPKIQEFIVARGNGEGLIPISCAFERQCLDAGDDLAKFEEEQGAKSILSKVIVSGYKALHLIHFYTVGPDEVRSWTVREGALAPKAAGVIHTDFEKGFIKAEAFHFKDLREHGSEQAVRAAGKLRMEGRKYVVQDGDILHFKASGGRGKK